MAQNPWDHSAATVFVCDFDSFLTAQILEDTTAVPSLEKLCEDHGYSVEWTGGQNNILLQKAGNSTQQGELRTHRCSGLVNQTFQLVYEYILHIGIAGLNGR